MRFGSRISLMAVMTGSLLSFLPGISFAQAERAVMPQETRLKRPANAPRKRRTGWFYDKPTRKRECERRMRQIARGQLKAENGLVAL